MSSGRRRSWLLLLLAAALVVSYLSVWTVYSAAHTYPRYRQLAPGASATSTSDPEHYRVLKLTASSIAAGSDGDPVRAAAGEVWVIARIEVTIDQREEYPGCGLSLLGPAGRLWEASSDAPPRKLPTYCNGDDVKPGVPFVFEQLFQVPKRYADQLRGLVLVNALTAAPSPVLTPA